MTAMSPEQWREKIGQHVEARRNELRISVKTAADRAGVSPTLWRWVESGTQKRGGHELPPNPKPETLGAIATALRWPPEALDNLAAGQPPYDPADAIVGEDAMAARMSEMFAALFIDHGPAGIPDYAINDDEYLRTLPADMFGLFMMERYRRQMEVRIARLEARMAALRPVVRELSGSALLDADDELAATPAATEPGAASQPEP